MSYSIFCTGDYYKQRGQHLQPLSYVFAVQYSRRNIRYGLMALTTPLTRHLGPNIRWVFAAFTSRPCVRGRSLAFFGFMYVLDTTHMRC
jgi:hypothetical protein